jgi:hypothetical protein
LRDILAEKYVWLHALRDIMTAVTLPDLDDADLTLISSEELKRRVVLATRVDLLWRKPIVPLKSIRTLPVGNAWPPVTVAWAKFLPGGEWLVLLLNNGTLCLQASNAAVPCVVDPDFQTENPHVHINLSLSERNETLVLLRTWSWDIACVQFIVPRWFQI